MIRLPSPAEYEQLTFNEKRICLERLNILRLRWLETENTSLTGDRK